MGIFDRGYVETSQFYESLEFATMLLLTGLVGYIGLRTFDNESDIIRMQAHRHVYQGDQKTSFPVDLDDKGYLAGGWY